MSGSLVESCFFTLCRSKWTDYLVKDTSKAIKGLHNSFHSNDRLSPQFFSDNKTASILDQCLLQIAKDGERIAKQAAKTMPLGKTKDHRALL